MHRFTLSASSPRCLPLWACALSVLALTACGGGGGDDDDEVAPTAAVSGVASKGLLANALVSAYAVRPDGGIGALVAGPVRTGSDGRYTLTGLNPNAVVVVQLTADGATSMKDEATGFTLTPPAGFSLRAAVVPAAGGTTSAHITPFSEAAVAQAESLPSGLSGSNVEAANASVATTLGFNPLTAAPEFAPDGVTPRNDAALKLAAVSLLAKNDELSVCATQSSQAAKVGCVVQQLAQQTLASSAVYDALGDAIDEAKSTWTEVAVAPPAPYVPPANSGSSTTAVALAKAFFANLRSNLRAIDDETSGGATVANEWRDLADEVQARVAPANAHTLRALGTLANAVDYYHEQVRDNPGSAIDTPRLFYAEGEVVGGCTLWQDRARTQIATAKANARFVGCYSLGVSYNESVQFTGGSYTHQYDRVNFGVLLVPGSSAGTFALTSRQHVARFTSVNGAEPTEQPLSTFPASGQPGLQASLELVDVQVPGQLRFTLQGDLAPVYDDSGARLGDKLVVNLVLGSQGVSADVTRYALEGLLAVWQGGAEDSRVVLASGSYVLMQNTVAGDLGSSIVRGSQTVAHLELQASTPEATVAGTLDLLSWVLDGSRDVYAPARSTFTGSLVRGSQKLFEGSLVAELTNLATYDESQPETPDNFLKARVTLNGQVHVPNRPALVLDIAFDGTQWDQDRFSGRYTQGPVTINFSGGAVDLEAEDPQVSVTFTSAEGISLSLVPGTNLANVTKNGVVVGVFDQDAARITYADNSFEIF